MNQHELVECDSCGNAVTQYPHETPPPYGFNYRTENPDEYYTESFQLCNECVRKIVDWIDDLDESETRIEPVSVNRLASGLARDAEELADLADRLKELTDR